MNKYILFFTLLTISSSAQLTTDRTAPYDSPVYLINDILLGSGVVASNHSFQGDSIQIGYFNGSASNLGLNGGIVMCTGDIAILDPTFAGFGDFVDVNPPVTDPDLLNIANSVPGLIGQTFSVSSINDVAVLEFDFVPSSDTVSFNYIFGSQEYFGFENSSYNDVFGFFISGPGIVGPYASPAAFPDGSINIATFESQEANSLGQELPITISSICNYPDDFGGPSVYNPQLFINNQDLTTVGDADGFTVVMKAETAVQCGQTYHIRLAIADGSDSGLSSYVFLEENSFSSPELDVLNNLGQDTSHIVIDCGTTVELTAQISQSGNYSYFWNNGQNTQSINVGEGEYIVEAISDNNCSTLSDTFYVSELNTIELEIGDDLTVCGQDEAYIQIENLQAAPPVSFSWDSGQSTENISVPAGQYILTISDANGCIGQDTIEVISLNRPTAQISGGGTICEGQLINIPLDVQLSGQLPFLLQYTNGIDNFVDTVLFSNYTIDGNTSGTYSLLSVEDFNCSGNVSGTSIIDTYKLPTTEILGGGVICDGDSSQIIVNVETETLPYNLFLNNGNYNQIFTDIQQTTFTIYLEKPAIYTVDKVIDSRGCFSTDNQGEAIISYKEFKNPEITTIIDSVICPIDEPFQLEALNPGGVWSGKGLGLDNYFVPVNAFMGTNWIYYSYPSNCNEIDSLAIELGCDLSIFIPNTFTPNGDNDNELLVIQGNNVITFEMSIYNRWGEKVFYTNDINTYWDGKLKGNTLATGTYTYIFTAYGKDAQILNKSGQINLIR
ncbi:MAG: choice-of-anchor L domain-containing protein [Flavobacteriales bacterium]